MRKSQALAHWQQLPEHIDPLPHMQPIEYNARGSRYGCCGIRIDGPPEFIDAVLSNLKPLLAGENNRTRLELSRAPVKGEKFANAEEGAEACYIRLHQRGHGANWLAGWQRSYREKATSKATQTAPLPF